MDIHYREGNPPTTEIPLDGQGKWLSVQDDGPETIIAISGPRGGRVTSVRLTADLAELIAYALTRKNLGRIDGRILPPGH